MPTEPIPDRRPSAPLVIELARGPDGKVRIRDLAAMSETMRRAVEDARAAAEDARDRADAEDEDEEPR